MSQTISSQYSSPVEAAVTAEVLTDENGSGSGAVTPYVYTGTSGVYQTTRSEAGAGTLSFCFNTDGLKSGKIGSILIGCAPDASVVDVNLHIKRRIGADWKDGGLAFSHLTDANLKLKASPGAGEVDAADFNDIPVLMLYSGTAIMLECEVSGPTTLICQFLGT